MGGQRGSCGSSRIRNGKRRLEPESIRHGFAEEARNIIDIMDQNEAPCLELGHPLHASP
ncbi:hypothetical protein J21TS7_60850 [Paenibacillus cineris]|uniref:Uncharacterized protein n=1 Tax=Paenibacillus cineris TaxID=237530 RepID=A0ABQ4LMS2_9BACL|nr:hypothetical protein J21TS7_60850 [Paenibacillus cineris]